MTISQYVPFKTSTLSGQARTTFRKISFVKPCRKFFEKLQKLKILNEFKYGNREMSHVGIAYASCSFSVFVLDKHKNPYLT